jgi:hypothetical protein
VAPVASSQTARDAAAAVAGLWSYETLTPAKGSPSRLNGYFLFKDGYFLQEALNEGEPFDQQLVQAHAGTFTTAGSTVTLQTEVQLGVRPTRTPAVSSTPGRTHQITPTLSGDALTLTFGSGTVQTFRRAGRGNGDLIRLERGAIALVDGRFIVVAEDAGRQVVGAGRAERRGDTLTLVADRWMTARDGRAKYERQVWIDGTLTGRELRLGAEAPFRVRGENTGAR